MSQPTWPTLEEVAAMAVKASDDGFVIELLQIDTGFEWVWKHGPSGMTFEGSCDCHVRAVAFVVALENLPVVVFVPNEDVDTNQKCGDYV